jgi:hypothetical protein
MRHVADRPGLTAGQVPGPGSVELLVDLLLLHRLAQLPVLLDGHHHGHHLAALTNHVVGVTSGQFAHEGHGNEVDRQHDVTTRHRSTKGRKRRLDSRRPSVAARLHAAERALADLIPRSGGCGLAASVRCCTASLLTGAYNRHLLYGVDV